MMGSLPERFEKFMNNRWLVFVAAMWVEACAGMGYVFGSYSPVIKSSLSYNQKEIARLGVAKDLGDTVGFIAGTLCEIFPLWGALFVGGLLNLFGYGWVWLVVTHRLPLLPLWVMCVLIFIGNNGETFFNTAALVSCVGNFPKNRGPVVGILKGFAGLGGAILMQIYTMIHSPDHASLILMVAVGPATVVFLLMFLIRPVAGHRQVRPSDDASFTFMYSICLILAAYLMIVMLLEDLVHLTHFVISIFTMILLFFLLLPAAIPLTTSTHAVAEESLLKEPEMRDGLDEVMLSHEVEDEKPGDEDLQATLFRAAAEAPVTVNSSRPHRGEDFTLTQALIKADFWLIFFSLLLGSGSGLTVIDNLGQISQSFGYNSAHIFVSMISIWNFLGRIGGGYFSEIIVRDYAYPRPVAMAIAQLVMAIGHGFFAFGWPGAMYIGTLLVGLSYGAHWAIMPAAASELFGMKKFGTLYNFLALANPAGSLFFSGLIASSIYDREAERQARDHHRRQMWDAIVASSTLVDQPSKCEGAVCFFLTSIIMSGLSLLAFLLTMILVRRTKIVYANMYGRPHPQAPSFL